MKTHRENEHSWKKSYGARRETSRQTAGVESKKVQTTQGEFKKFQEQ